MSGLTTFFSRFRLNPMVASATLLLIGAASFGCEDCPIGSDSPCGPTVLTAGVGDEFSRSNPEPASLHPDFRALLETRTNPIEANFDGVTIDRHFGHSFMLPECSGVRIVKSARLTMRLRASGDGSTDQTRWYIRNDEGELQHVWGASIPRDLAGGSWHTGRAQTFAFDLGAMPLVGGDPANNEQNLLPYLSNGELHVHVQDDTSVDFITLEIVSCCGEREERVVVP